MNAQDYFYAKTVRGIVAALEENEPVMAANILYGAAASHNFSIEGTMASVRVVLYNEHGDRAGKFLACMTAGVSMRKAQVA